jgi:hypothetical protein
MEATAAAAAGTTVAAAAAAATTAGPTKLLNPCRVQDSTFRAQSLKIRLRSAG